MTLSRAVARAGLLGAVLMAGAGCGEEEGGCPPLVVRSDEACETTADCVEAGFSTLQCVNGRCGIACASDSDCALEASPACIASQGPPPDAVCVDLVCRAKCGEQSCADGEQCAGGRCVLGAEGFEARPDEPVSSLERFGWNQLEGAELKNPTVVLASTGISGCNLGDPNCAGVAAEGERYVLIGTQGTSEKGTASLEPTCRPCACCLECQAHPELYADGSEGCPLGREIPAPLMCVDDAVCASVCTACDGCLASELETGPNLVACEARAAQRTCPACPRCEADACRSCRETSCGEVCEALSSTACVECEMANCGACVDCRACDVCGQAASCARIDPNAADCRNDRRRCDALGDDGCFPTPVGYARSELSEAEQALTSPPLGLAPGAADVVLAFTYVPFRVGRTYFESRQGVPASMWQRRTQEVLVQLCSSGCEAPDAWVDAEAWSGGAASLPDEGGRENGVSVGKQSEVDWRRGRMQVRIPSALRGPQLRVRFLPRLGAEARVGLDDLMWWEAE